MKDVKKINESALPEPALQNKRDRPLLKIFFMLLVFCAVEGLVMYIADRLSFAGFRPSCMHVANEDSCRDP